jgi:hypothetical protein
MKKIIHGQNFTLNEGKTRLQKRGYRQEVTGLTVNEKPNLNRRYIRQVRAMLNNWEKYGLVQAVDKFKKDYALDKGHVKDENNKFTHVLRGKLNYMRMVRGVKDPLYQKYKDQFVRLEQEETTNSSLKDVDVSEIIKIWSTQGIEAAMKKYNKYYESEGD